MVFCTVTTFCLIRNKHIQQNNASLLNTLPYMSRIARNPVFGVSNPVATQTAVQPQKMPRGLNFGFRNKRDWAIYVAKTRALISCAITAHLICTFVFTYAKKEVHSWHSSWTQLDSNRSTYVRHISHRLQRLLVGRSIILYSQRTIKVLIKLSGMICTFIVGISQKRESVILILILFGTYDMYIMVYKS